MSRSRLATAILVTATVVAVYFCYLLVAPFLKPIIFSVILAFVFYPAHERIHRWIRNKSVSAMVSTTMVSLVVAFISILLGSTIVSGLRDVYQSLAGSRDGQERLSLYFVHLFDRALEVIGRYITISLPDLQSAALNQAERAVSGLLTISAGVLGGITSLAANALIVFFLLFFFFRDGRSMLRRMVAVAPLRRDQVRRLFTNIKEALNAIVYGTIAMAALQGALTGIAFWFLGLSSPALWGVVAGLCALLPIIGTAFVLLPATCMLIFSGHWIKGLILLIWSLAVVHPIDNVLRPVLIGERVRLSTLYVFFALVGGLRTFGALGAFIGPLILVVTIALFRFLREETRTGPNVIQMDPKERARAGSLQFLD